MVRVKRHRVGWTAVSAVREDFANRIGSLVHSLAKAGPVTGWEWWLIAQEFVEYLGALSVETPDLRSPEAKAVLEDAAEAAAGAVAYAAYFPRDHFEVFLTYPNWGLVYDREPGGTPEPVTAATWLDAFCLAILVEKAQWHGEAFHFAREAPQRDRSGQPDAELINGFMAYVIGDTADDDVTYPPSRERKLASLDAALDRVRARGTERGAPLAEEPYGIGLRALRALAAGDREGFGEAVVRLLLPLADTPGTGARPGSLLPLLPIALTALAYRHEGWPPAADSDYLPDALVLGFEAAPPRVGPYGRDRRPDAVARLAAGVVEFERNLRPHPLDPDSEEQFERYARDAVSPPPGRSPTTFELAYAVTYQELLFTARAAHTPDASDAQLANLWRAAELGAALFRTTPAEPGTEVRVTIDGTEVTYPACRDEDAGADGWHRAVRLALITGRREHLAPLVPAGPERVGPDRSPSASYRRALHDYLRGEDPEPATDQALLDAEKARDRGALPPPAVLFSQLVEGDEESFNLALLDALTAHRDHYAVADRPSDPAAALNLDILALVCHARRRGWEIGVRSPYLPPRIVGAAKPF